MKLKKRIILLGVSLLLIGSTSMLYAQQDPQYTQYMYNTNMVNPAYVGSRENLNIFGIYRAQWVGLDGAPKTANISVTTPLGQNGLALGVSFTNDRIGAMDENNISVDLAYTIDLNEDYRLAFGLKTTANLLSVDYTKLNIYDPTDPTTQVNIKNKFNPNIGAGLYMYSDKAYVGVSVPNFLTTDRYNDNDLTTMRQKMHFYLMGGYVFDLSRDVLFKPAALVKAVSGAPLQVDLTANFLLYEKFTLGAAYRWDASVSALAGFQINNSLFIGYSYDFETTKLHHYNSGSHEVFMKFELFKRTSKVNTPRFF